MVEEARIVTACNLNTSEEHVKTELYDLRGDVRIVHHSSGEPNEADDRLLSEIEEFAESSASPPSQTKLVVITGDGDFVDSLKGLRRRKYKIHVVYPKHKTSEKLVNVANTNHVFETLLESCLKKNRRLKNRKK